MKCTCPISGLTWSAEYISASTSQAHPFFALGAKKIPSLLSLWQSQRMSPPETHLLFTRLLLDTEHVVFHTPLFLTEILSQVENAQMERLAKLTFSGSFQKENIDLPAFFISKDSQDVSEILSIWESELDNYRISAMIARQQHEIRAMLSRVQRAFSNPLAKSRKQIITSWMLKCCTLPEFQIIHPISRNSVPCADYWIELLGAAIEGSPMLSYPEKDIIEFKEHLEENLPLNYAQEFSLLEELRGAINRKQNYFGYSFTDADDRSYAINEVKPMLSRSNYSSTSEFLNAIKNSRSQKGI